MGYLRILIVIFFTFSTNAPAAGTYLVGNAKVIGVTNTGSGGAKFTVKKQGGSEIQGQEYFYNQYFKSVSGAQKIHDGTFP